VPASTSRSSRRLSAAALVVAAVLAGCGSTTKPALPVRLSVDGPPDMAVEHSNSVEVHGTVSPATARVTVEGRDVAVHGGQFSTNVGLAPGTNLIDVVAGAKGGARPAMLALRVRRQVTVAVPDLTGLTPNDAKDALASLGLQADIKKAGGILEFLLPEDARVCDTDPPAQTSVNPGTTVTVFAAKAC
jgi:PASTA domain-containing protein/glucodextranase-like protein